MYIFKVGVISEKTPEGLQPKACLVACAFEENCL